MPFNASGGAAGLADVPAPLVVRLCQYFATYKVLPGQANPVELQDTYARLGAAGGRAKH